LKTQTDQFFREKELQLAQLFIKSFIVLQNKKTMTNMGTKSMTKVNAF